MIENHLKIPPNSVEAEESVIGGLILGAPFDEVFSVVQSSDFYRPVSQIIFSAIGNMASKNSPVDIITLSEYLSSRGELDNVGGLSYLADIAKNTPSFSNIMAYAEVVKDRALQRSLLQKAQSIAGLVYTDGIDTSQKIAMAQSEILSVDSDGQSADVIEINDVLKVFLDSVDNKDEHQGYKTGFPELDRLLIGLERGCVHVIAARPGTGKTALALNIVEHNVFHAVPTLVFSLEMTSKALGRRLISSVGKIDNRKIREKNLENGDWERLSAAVTRLKDKKLYICEKSGMTVEKIRSISRMQKRARGIEIICIDFLQLISRTGSKGKSTADEIGHISKQIKDMAKELDVAVILLSQLNRNIEGRADKTPTKSDLKASGDIEEDAETITFLHRANMDESGETDVVVGKNRDGENGAIKLILNGKYSRFDNLSYLNK